jgi:DNA damage-inducible protein 1
MKIGTAYLHAIFDVLEEQPMDVLLGLDMLRRHQCVIDLHRNVLVVTSSNTETLFLQEHELPAHARPGYVDKTKEDALLQLQKTIENGDKRETGAGEL